MLPANYSFRT